MVYLHQKKSLLPIFEFYLMDIFLYTKVLSQLQRILVDEKSHLNWNPCRNFVWVRRLGGSFFANTTTIQMPYRKKKTITHLKKYILHHFQIQMYKMWLRCLYGNPNKFLCNVISFSLHILVQCLKEKSKIISFSSLFIYGCVFSVCIVAARCE